MAKAKKNWSLHTTKLKHGVKMGDAVSRKTIPLE